MSHAPTPSRAEKDVTEALHRFYFCHHDENTLREELIKLVKESRVRSFNEVKKRVQGAVDYRVSKIESTHALNLVCQDSKARLDELRELRKYVHGMVVKVDES